MISRRAFLPAAAAAALGACSRRSSAGEVNVYCWSDYFAPDTIAAFERETRIRVNYETFESQEEMLAKIQAGGSGWDVVFPDNSHIGPLASQDDLEPLDHALLPNLSNLDPRFVELPWDRGNRLAVPYTWGVTGIIYNSRVMPRGLVSWAGLWDPALRGKITMLDDPADVIGACLKKLGFGLNSTDPGELAAAREEAVRQKPLLRAYISAEVKPQLIAGDVWAAQLWNGDAYQAISENPDLKFCLPSEGFALYADSAAVLKRAPNPRAAYQWINYLLRPDVGASIARAAFYATPNAKARQLLDAQMRDNPDLYPPPARLAKAEWFAELPPAAQLLRDRLWTEIKAA